MPRDLYVYLPPGYDPSQAYPLIIFLHGADVDEHAMLDPSAFKALDWIISRVDPSRRDRRAGRNIRRRESDQFHPFALGQRPRWPFRRYVVYEVLPFVVQSFSIRPEHKTHAMVGISAGGFGAMAIAMKHRELFAAAATIAAPLNLRYDTVSGRYSDKSNPRPTASASSTTLI